jgi:hypothetical protein
LENFSFRQYLASSFLIIVACLMPFDNALDVRGLPKDRFDYV